MLNMKVKYYAQGRDVSGRFMKLATDVIVAGKDMSSFVADNQVMAVKAYIRAGGMPYIGLSKYTKKHRRNSTSETRPLVDTSFYANNIEKKIIHETENKIEYQVAAANVIHPIAGISLRILSYILEYGNPLNRLFGNPAPIPARPHFAPAYELTSKAYKNICKNWLSQVLSRF